MSRRSEPDAPPRRLSGVPETAHIDLEAFEREYTIERFTQRDLMLDLGAVLWFVTFFFALSAGQLTDGHPGHASESLRFAIAGLCAGVGVAMLTVIRRLDDQRTVQAIAVLSVLALLIQYALSFYGPGALGGMFVGQVAVCVYTAQFLSARGIAGIMALLTGFAVLATAHNYATDYAPHILSQTTLLVIVLWAVAYSIFALKQDRAAALEEAERTAFADTLTGLPNTRMLRRRTEALLDGRNERINRRTGIVLLDLDGFRTANTLRGHRHGDRILQAAGTAIYRVIGRDQFVARTGSDEFSVLVPSTTLDELVAAGERVRSAVLSAIDEVATDGVEIDASVGVAISGPGVDSFDSLMRTADRAMYLDKVAHSRAPRARTARTPVAAQVASPMPGSSDRQQVRQVSRLRTLSWSQRPTQARFFSVAWTLSAVAVLIAMNMPDAAPHNSAAVFILAAGSFVYGIARYLTPPSTTFAMQLIDVLLASGALALAIWITGKGTSPAVPIELLVLIYIGWFLPLRAVIPMSLLSIAIILVPTLFAPSVPLSTMDAVTVYGGLAITSALMVILYYNHYYILRARALTDQLAWLDPRAGAYNRRAFEERISEELDQLNYGDREALAVVMVDLGNFKSVSAEHGRAAADEILSEVARTLVATSREEDCVARLGGDVFGIVAPGVTADSARALTQRLVSAVREALEDSDLPATANVRPSAGFALYGMHGRTTDELVAAADIALTAARTSGRDPDRVSSFVVAL